MIARIKEVYAAHHWPKLAASLALLLSGILLFRLEGGFPPLAWRFLFQVVPQLPILWAQHGAATLLPLLGLIVLSLALLILWVLLVMLELMIYTDWWRTSRSRSIAPARGSDQFDWQPNFPEDLYSEDEADNFAELDLLEDSNARAIGLEGDVEDEYPAYPLQMRQQASESSRRKRESITSMNTRPDPITNPGPQATPSRRRPVSQQQSGYRLQSLAKPQSSRSGQAPAESMMQAQSQQARQIPSEPLVRSLPQPQTTQSEPAARRPIALPPTNYASQPMPAAPAPNGSKPPTSGRKDSRPSAPVSNGRQTSGLGRYESKPSGPSRKDTQPETPDQSEALSPALDKIGTQPLVSDMNGSQPPAAGKSSSKPPVSNQNGSQPLVSSRNRLQPPVPTQGASTFPDPYQTLPLPNDSQAKTPSRPVPAPQPAQTPREDVQTPPSLPVARALEPISIPKPSRPKAPGTGEPGKSKATRLLPASQKAPDTDQILPGQVQVQLLAGSRLDPGRARKGKPNEDNLICFQGMHATSNGIQPFGLFVVADGMGGHANGQEASHIAINEVSNAIFAALLQNDGPVQAYATLLTESVQQANRQLFQRNKSQEELMGTTITAALVVGLDAYVANVGDSRTYLYRNGAGLRQITRDHSIVARFVELGTIGPEDVYSHPLRNQIYRCLGEQAAVQIDSFTTKLQNGDKLLLCSDGLWEMVQNQGIQRIFAQEGTDPNKICEEFVQAALDGGGDDNISSIVVYVQQVGSSQPAQPSPLQTKVWPLEEGMDAI